VAGVKARAAAAAALLGVVAIGCSGSGGDASPDTVGTTGSAATTSTTEPLPTSTTASPAPTTTEAAVTTTVAPRPTLEDLLARGRVNIAHAGGELEGPDETIFAFRQALANGADVLEMNVQLSADGQLVLHHDATVDAKTDGTGPVVGKTAAELNALDAAHWWVPDAGTVRDRPEADYVYRGVRTGAKPPPQGATPDDFGVPSFQQVVDAFPGVVLDVEMEAEAGPGVVPVLAGLIDANDLHERIVVSSFDDALMEQFRALQPDVAASPGLQVMTGFYTNPGPLPGYRILQVPPKFGEVVVLTPAFIAAAKANDLVLWVWPNDDSLETEAAYRDFLAQGLDGVINDRPSVMAALEG
jgi:glycerophosphoryl diester phosphodiesterase